MPLPTKLDLLQGIFPDEVLDIIDEQGVVAETIGILREIRAIINDVGVLSDEELESLQIAVEVSQSLVVNQLRSARFQTDNEIIKACQQGRDDIAAVNFLQKFSQRLGVSTKDLRKFQAEHQGLVRDIVQRFYNRVDIEQPAHSSRQVEFRLGDNFTRDYPDIARSGMYDSLRGEFCSYDLSWFAAIFNDYCMPYLRSNELDVNNITITLATEADITGKGLNELFSLGASINDVMTLTVLKHQKKSWDRVKIKVDPSRAGQNIEDIPRISMILWTLLVFRGHSNMSENERLPSICRTIVGDEIDEWTLKFKQFMGPNVAGDRPHANWMNKIKIDGLPIAFQNRARQGLCGSRYFNIFMNENPDSDASGTVEELKKAYEIVKNVALNGPYWEMHPFYTPKEFEGRNLKMNLHTMFVGLYKVETQARIRDYTGLREVPGFDPRKYNWWKGFTDETFSCYRTRLFRHVVVPQVNELSG